MHRPGCASIAVALVALALTLGGARGASAQGTPAEAPPVSAPIAVAGVVLDALGRPVRGASVALEGGGAAVTTDAQGRFELVAPIGAMLFVTSPRAGEALVAVTGPVLEEITLLVGGEQIEIGGEVPPAAPGAAVLDREELQRLPGAGGDVVRALAAMPGVVNTQLPLGYSGVVIRGASPQDSKVMVDDFEIPLLFHPFGFRAVVPAESIDSLTFIPGGFDVAHGRSSSGVVLLSTRAGGPARSAQAEASLIDGGIITQGPLGERTRGMFALRRSFIDFVLPLVLPDSVDLSLTTVPQYWDGQLRIDHELSEKWTLSLSGLGTSDVFELYTTKDEDAGTKRFFSRTRFLRLTAAAKFHSGQWQSSLALSGMLTELRAEVGLYQRLRTVTPLITPRATVTRTMAEAAGLADVVVSAGLEHQLGTSDIEIALPLERREGEPMGAYDPKDTSANFRGTVWFPDTAAWAQVAASFDERMRLTAGLRLDHYGRPGQVLVQPRGELQIKLTSKLTTRLSAGMYSRPPEYQTEFLDDDVQAERSRQLVAGLEYAPVLGVRLQGSTYYTDRTSLITRNADASLGNDGRGTSKGAELLAMVFGGSWFGWIGYSYSNSQREDAPGARRRLFDYDQPHSLNLAASWRRGRWQLGGRFQLYSGLPLTPIVDAELDSDRNLYLPVPGEVNSERAPTHHQLDVRLDYHWKWGRLAMLAFLDVQNVYVQRSIVTYFYSYDYSQRSAFEALPLVPSFGLRGVL